VLVLDPRGRAAEDGWCAFGGVSGLLSGPHEIRSQ
jgi:hypothetical protein